MKMTRKIVRCSFPVVLILISLLKAPVLPAAEYDRAESYELKLTKDTMVPMRDGIKLATDIYLPAQKETMPGGSFPVILMRTPYNKNGQSPVCEFFARRGYAVVVQDVRGQYNSGGEFYIYLNEGEDGIDTMNWIEEQSWCNGRIGTYGGSYLAATQNAIAALGPASLKSMFVIVGTSSYIEDGAARGGAFALLHNLDYCLRLAGSGKESMGDPNIAAALSKAYSQLPLWLLADPLKADSPLQWIPSYRKWYSDWRPFPPGDEYWKQNGYNFEEFYGSYPDIPIYFVGGWYDIFKRGTLQNYTALSKRLSLTRLLMGPWTHSTGISYAGDVDFGASAEMSLIKEALRWFDQTLLRLKLGIETEPPVKYFLMKGENPAKNKDGRMQSRGLWKAVQAWPPEGIVERLFYLQPDRSLHSSPPAKPALLSYVFDPEDPVPTIGGNIDSGKQLVPRGAQDQTPPEGYFAAKNVLPLSVRHDVLSFETPPLDSDIEVTGPVKAVLYVSSEARDTDFTAKLVDVYPPSTDYPSGYAMNLEDGILRMRYRKTAGEEEFMIPGTVYEITIDLWATANAFSRGHKIRLDISSSNFPMYDVNPNTGDPIGKHIRSIPVINTLHVGPSHPSHLVLPVQRKF